MVSSEAFALASLDVLIKKNFHEVKLIGHFLDGSQLGSAMELKMHLFKKQYQ